MGSVRDVKMAIFFLFELILGHPLIAVSEKLPQLHWTYRKLSIEWHKSLLSKLPSFGFYPSLCSFISSFLSGRSISAVVDGHCSSPKPIKSGVPQGSVLSPTVFLLFINDLLSINNCSIHSYADDSTLHFLTSLKEDTLQDLQDSRMEAAERLTSDLANISDWGRGNLVSFNAS